MSTDKNFALISTTECARPRAQQRERANRRKESLSRHSLHVCLAAALLLLAGGCQSTRSISNSGYYGENGIAASAPRELNEFDVLGIEPGRPVSEEEIAQASAHAQRVALKEGSSILLIQSGAVYPDGPMITGLEKHFNVIPFTGIAEGPTRDPLPIGLHPRNVALITNPGQRVTLLPFSNQTAETATNTDRGSVSYSRLVRLAAARAGADTVVCYWGILESASEKMATKTVSWVPVVHWIVPDERQHMRIRVKLAVIDVRTGNWRMVSPEPFEAKSWSTSPRREVVDKKQVESLKAKAYEASVKELATICNISG